MMAAAERRAAGRSAARTGNGPGNDRHRPQPPPHPSPSALRTLLQVPAQPPLGPHPQAAARVRAEPVGVAGAVAARRQGLADVRLEVGLLQPFPGAARQYGRGVGGQPEQRRDLARRLLLDGRVPQHRLPALRQQPERPQGERPLGLLHGPHVGAHLDGVPAARLHRARGLRGEDREVLDELFPPGGPRPGRGDTPDGRQQIRPHGLLGPGPAPHRLQGPGEHLGRQVVGGVVVPAAGARVPQHGRGVPPEQLRVRGVVAAPHPLHQLGVGRRQLHRRRQHRIRHGIPPWPGTRRVGPGRTGPRPGHRTARPGTRRAGIPTSPRRPAARCLAVPTAVPTGVHPGTPTHRPRGPRCATAPRGGTRLVRTGSDRPPAPPALGRDLSGGPTARPAGAARPGGTDRVGAAERLVASVTVHRDRPPKHTSDRNTGPGSHSVLERPYPQGPSTTRPGINSRTDTPSGTHPQYARHPHSRHPANTSPAPTATAPTCPVTTPPTGPPATAPPRRSGLRRGPVARGGARSRGPSAQSERPHTPSRGASRHPPGAHRSHGLRHTLHRPHGPVTHTGASPHAGPAPRPAFRRDLAPGNGRRPTGPRPASPRPAGPTASPGRGRPARVCGCSRSRRAARPTVRRTRAGTAPDSAGAHEGPPCKAAYPKAPRPGPAPDREPPAREGHIQAPRPAEPPARRTTGAGERGTRQSHTLKGTAPRSAVRPAALPVAKIPGPEPHPSHSGSRGPQQEAPSRGPEARGPKQGPGLRSRELGS